MPWPAGTSVEITGATLTPVPGTNGASWAGDIVGVITLSTGQTLNLNHSGAIPAALATALQTLVTNAVAAEGVTLNWP
jgi:hypothetical protein